MSNAPCFIFLTTLLFFSLLRKGSAADPSCSNGISVLGACCPSICGQCGGVGCEEKSEQFNTYCCVNQILEASRNVPLCLSSNSPCRISLQLLTNTSYIDKYERNSVSTLGGSWRHTSVESGELVKRHEACAVSVRGLVVLVGGRGANKPVSIFDPRTGVWTQHEGPGAGIEIHHFQCVAIRYRIWIVSSWTGKYPFEKNNENIYIYNVKTDKWSTKKGMATERLRGGAATVVRGDWIYVVAGNQGGHGEHASSLSYMDGYNYKENRWADPGTFQDMPGNGRDHVGGALVNDELCIAGGRDGGSQKFFGAVKVETYCYNFNTTEWSRRSDFSVGRAGAMTASTCDGRMMVAGGEGNGIAYDRVDVFDGSNWEQAPSLVSARHGSGLAVSRCTKCGHIFIPSGSGKQGGSPELLTTEEYVPEGSPSRCWRY